MLTVQPRFNTQQSNLRKTSFKGEMAAEFQSGEDAKRYFQEQAKDFKKLENDTHTPSFLKPILKGLRILAEASVEGFAVFVATKKGAEFMKGGAATLAKSSIVKNASSITGSVVGALKSVGKFISTHLVNGMEKLAEKPFVKNLERRAKIHYYKFSKTKIGKPITQALSYLKGKFVAFGEYLSNKINKKSEKPVDTSAAFDKATNKVANTLGVGSGVAGAYGASIRENEKNKAENKQADEDYDSEDIDDEDPDRIAPDTDDIDEAERLEEDE